MAIDTAEKRRSVAGLSIGWGVTPNSSKDIEWRQQVAWSYSGISAASGVITGPLCMTISHSSIYTATVASDSVYTAVVSHASVYTATVEDVDPCQ